MSVHRHHRARPLMPAWRYGHILAGAALAALLLALVWLEVCSR